MRSSPIELASRSLLNCSLRKNIKLCALISRYDSNGSTLDFSDDFIQNALGRVSFTSDVWSRQTMQSFMGVTAHFIARSPLNVLTLETRLVAFRVLHGSHTGNNLANEFLRVIEEIECLNKVCYIVI